MKKSKEYKYITINYSESDAKKQHYLIFNKKYGDLLGEIGWYSPWRQYCFMPQDDTVFSRCCLNDIIDFINELNQPH